MTPVTITPDDIAPLRVNDDELPNSRQLDDKLRQVCMSVEELYSDEEWFQTFIWGDESPYIGPNDPDESSYLWLGLAHSQFQSVGGPTKGLQFEFGIDVDSNRGFFGRSVVCGLYFGPWADATVVDTMETHIEKFAPALASVLNEQLAYVLMTADNSWKEMSIDTLRDQASALSDGFVLTHDLELADLYAFADVSDLVCRTIVDLLPLYGQLSGLGPDASLLVES